MYSQPMNMAPTLCRVSAKTSVSETEERRRHEMGCGRRFSSISPLFGGRRARFPSSFLVTCNRSVEVTWRHASSQ